LRRTPRATCSSKLPRDERLEERIEEIQEVVEQEKTDTGLGALWRARWVRPALIVACGLAILNTIMITLRPR
jgi:hypothetical protein